MSVHVKSVGLLLLTMLVAAPAQARPLYVNNSGSAACSDETSRTDNGEEQPWCTLLRAVRGNSDGDRNTPAVPGEAAQAGDTVHVAAGTYHYEGAWEAGGWLEPLYESVNSGTSWDAPIVYRAEGTVQLTVGAGVHASTFGGAAQYVEWNGFTVDQATATFRNGLTTITASHVRFENLTLIGEYTALGGDNHAGIMLHGPRDGDCTDAIGDIVIRNCTMRGFTGDSGRNDAGMTMYCAAGGSSGQVLIEHNEFSGNGNGIHAKSSYTRASSVPAVIVRRNAFYDNGGSGIMTQAWSNWHIYQNLFRDNAAAAIAILAFEYYVGAAQPNGYVISNNTLVRNAHGFRLEGFCLDASGMRIRNNIVVGSTGSSIWGESPDCSAAMSRSNYDFDDNLYEQDGSLGELHYEEFSLATWQSDAYDNQDPHSAEDIDPQFTDPGGDDYTLQDGSPCWEGGSNDGVDVIDLDGDGATDDAITLGAYITGDEVIGPTDMAPSGGTCVPSVEVCGNAVDEDCDGVLDNGCPGTPSDAGMSGGPGDGGASGDGGPGGAGDVGLGGMVGSDPSDGGCAATGGIGATEPWAPLSMLALLIAWRRRTAKETGPRRTSSRSRHLRRRARS